MTLQGVTGQGSGNVDWALAQRRRAAGGTSGATLEGEAEEAARELTTGVSSPSGCSWRAASLEHSEAGCGVAVHDKSWGRRRWSVRPVWCRYWDWCVCVRRVQSYYVVLGIS